MCNQVYVRCTNLKCDGVAENLALIPCENKPNCETTYTPVPGPKKESKKDRVRPYCPACSGMTKRERRNQLQRAARQARDAGTPVGLGGYARHDRNNAVERQKQLFHTRRALTVVEEGANAQGAQANVAQDNTHGGVFGVFPVQSESLAMGKLRGDIGRAFRSRFNASFSHAGPSGEPVSGSSTTGPQPFHVNLADIFPPRPTLEASPAPPLPTGPDNQMLPSSDTSGLPPDHWHPRYAIPSDSTALPHAEDESSGAGDEPQDAQESDTLEMADWADGVSGPPPDHWHPRYAAPSNSTAPPHAEDDSSGAGEQELLQMVDWTDGVLGGSDGLE
ncbi:hypothetical protein MMC07_006401 [Pseudocyphellaria aurata]|nr:hypothetical protein [Pseudocyphellaria aurata]